MEDRTDRGFLQYIQCQSDPNRRHGIQYVGARDARRVAERHEHFAGASHQIRPALRLLGSPLRSCLVAPGPRSAWAKPRLTRALPGGWAPERIGTCSAPRENLRLGRSSPLPNPDTVTLRPFMFVSLATPGFCHGLVLPL